MGLSCSPGCIGDMVPPQTIMAITIEEKEQFFKGSEKEKKERPLHWQKSPFFFPKTRLLYAELSSEFAGSWLNQNGAIGEDNRRHASCAFIHPYNDFGCALILFNIDVLVGNAVRIEPALRKTTISTPGGCIHLNLFSSLGCLYRGFCHK